MITYYFMLSRKLGLVRVSCIFALNVIMELFCETYFEHILAYISSLSIKKVINLCFVDILLRILVEHWYTKNILILFYIFTTNNYLVTSN